MHDDTQVARVQQMTEAITDGIFPVRVVHDLGYGYGYPIFNFYAPFAYYVGSGFDLIGFDELFSTKLMVGIALFVLGYGMYLLSSRFFGRAGGIISGVIAITSPYIALNIFVRGAFSELYGIAFIPFVFYAFFQVHQTRKFRYVVLGSFAFAAIIASHNLSAMMVTPFILLFSVFLLLQKVKTQKKKNLLILVTLISGVLLSSFYWLPALSEMKYTNVSGQVGGGADYRDHFVCLMQLWDSPWGFGGSTASCTDGMSYRVGKLHLIFVFLITPLLFMAKQKRTKVAIGFGLGVFIISVFLTLQISQLIWEGLRVMEYIQYPWRYLGITSLSIAFLAGGIVLYPKTITKNLKTQRTYIGVLIVLVAIGSLGLYLKLFMPQQMSNLSANDYTNVETIRYTTSKLSDEYLPKDFKKPEYSKDVPRLPYDSIQGSSNITVESDTTKRLVLSIDANEDSEILIHKAYFPFWHIFVDGKEVPFDIIDRGLVVSLPEGEHTIEVLYKSTVMQMIGNTLSIIGIIVIFVGIILTRRDKQYEQ